jgi:hypothetical protein
VERLFITNNADALGMVAPLMEVELTSQMARETIRRQVKGSLVGQRPGLHNVAHQLRLGARTLQRRLSVEKATFQPLKEEARRQLARHYPGASVGLRGRRFPQRCTVGEGTSFGDLAGNVSRPGVGVTRGDYRGAT